MPIKLNSFSKAFWNVWASLAVYIFFQVNLAKYISGGRLVSGGVIGGIKSLVSFEGLFCLVKFNVCCCCINNWASASELASKEFVEDLFCFLGLLFSGDDLAESLLLLLELFRLAEQCLFLFLDLGLVAGICLARLLTAFARVATDLLCFLYSPSSLKTLSEVSIVAVLLILLLDCSGWATGCVCGMPRLGKSEYCDYFLVFSFIVFKIFDVRQCCCCITFSFWHDY